MGSSEKEMLSACPGYVHNINESEDPQNVHLDQNHERCEFILTDGSYHIKIVAVHGTVKEIHLSSDYKCCPMRSSTSSEKQIVTIVVKIQSPKISTVYSYHFLEFYHRGDRMAKKGMNKPEVENGEKNTLPPVPEIQGRAKTGKEKANPIIAGTFGPDMKVYHHVPASSTFRVLDNDLARDNLENDIPFADLQD